jgi:hypothetical protein
VFWHAKDRRENQKFGGKLLDQFDADGLAFLDADIFQNIFCQIEGDIDPIQ